MSYQKIREKSFLQLIFCSRVTRKRVKMAWSGMLQEIYIPSKMTEFWLGLPVQLTLIINHIMLQPLYLEGPRPYFFILYINCSRVTRKRVKMAPYGGKGGILHLSYLRNEFGYPNFFSVFTRAYHKLHPWKVSANSHFQNNIITDELPCNCIVVCCFFSLYTVALFRFINLL